MRSLSRATRFARLPAGSQQALLRAALALCWVRLTLRRNRWQEAIQQPNPLTIATTSPPARGLADPSPARSAERGVGGAELWAVEAWAVKAASRHLFFTPTCLVQALALRTLLLRKGYTSRLRLGVAKDSDALMDAHAWLEMDGRVLIGGEAAGRFVPLS